MSSEANIVKDLIDRGLQPIQADMARFSAGLHAMTAANEKPSASAMARSARRAAMRRPHTRRSSGPIRATSAWSRAGARHFAVSSTSIRDWQRLRGG